MAEFGTPETWNMKVGDFIETQLPKEKPQALLDLQEQNRKQRLLDSLQKIGPGLMDESLDFIRRTNLYDGGVVEFAKNLSDEGKNTDEILEAIQKQFPDLPGGKKGKPTEKTGLQNILKKELSSEVYNKRHGAKRFTQETIDKYLELRDTKNKAQIQEELDISPAKQGKIDKEYGLGRRKQIVTDKKFSSEDIEKFKELRKTMSAPEIREELGMSESYQTKLARDLKLPSKEGAGTLSKKFSEAESVGTAVKNKIDPTKTFQENFDAIYPEVKDEKFRIGTTKLGKPSERAIKEGIGTALMEANQLSVDEYKDEIRKMVDDRSYAPKGLDPLGIKTDKLTNYAIPNYSQAKAELANEIPSLDKRISTNITFRKKLKRKQKEIADPSLKLSRLSQRARRGQKSRLEKLGLTVKLSPREEAINQTQTSIQKSSNDRIKGNPEAMKKFLQDNPEKLKALGTRVNRQTGEIFYENPNLKFLNKDPKDTQRFFELDHGREISKQAGRLTDVPENRNTIPGVLNRGFKRDAEIYIESNPNPKDPKVQAILEEAKKLKVRIRPKVPTGTFKADDFFRPIANPLLKIQDSISFYAPDEFQTKEIVLPKDRRGKVFLGLTGKETKIPTEEFRPGLQPDGRLVDLEGGQSKGFFGGEELAKGVIKTLQTLGTPAGVVAGELGLPGGVRSQLQEEGLEQTLRNPLSYAGLPLANIGAEAVKNPALQRILNLGLPLKVIRAGTPVGLGLMGISALVDSALKFQEEFDALSPEEQKAYLEEQEKFGEDIQGAAEGGIMRLNLADGPDKKGLKSPARRKFMKDTGKLAGILALIPYLGKFLAPVAKSPAAVEGVKLGFDKFMMLVNKIKELGTPTSKVTQKEREVGYTYTGKDGSEYELVEDLTTGDIRVTKDKPGFTMSGDEAFDTIEDRSTFVLKKGQADETTKGKTPPDEYDEVKEVPGPDGTFDDVDEVSDKAVKEVLDEID